MWNNVYSPKVTGLVKRINGIIMFRVRSLLTIVDMLLILIREAFTFDFEMVNIIPREALNDDHHILDVLARVYIFIFP